MGGLANDTSGVSTGNLMIVEQADSNLLGTRGGKKVDAVVLI
jgi:hypothetical protein